MTETVQSLYYLFLFLSFNLGCLPSKVPYSKIQIHIFIVLISNPNVFSAELCALHFTIATSIVELSLTTVLIWLAHVWWLSHQLSETLAAPSAGAKNMVLFNNLNVACPFADQVNKAFVLVWFAAVFISLIDSTFSAKKHISMA